MSDDIKIGIGLEGQDQVSSILKTLESGFNNLSRNLQRSMSRMSSDVSDSLKEIADAYTGVGSASKSSTDRQIADLKRVQQQARLSRKELAESAIQRAGGLGGISSSQARQIGVGVSQTVAVNEAVAAAERYARAQRDLADRGARATVELRQQGPAFNANAAAAAQAAKTFDLLKQRIDKQTASVAQARKEYVAFTDSFKAAESAYRNLPGPGREDQRATLSNGVGSSFFSSPLVASQFSEADRVAQQASRSYSNLSTQIDGAIDARRREASTFAATLQARMQEQAATERSAIATANQTTAVQNLESRLPRLRYAMYDVSRSLAVVSAALIGTTVATGALAIKFQRDFANVERSVADLGEGPIRGLRSQIDELFRTLPVGFGTLTEIAKLGGQLSVPAAQLAEFTELVAKFTATTDVSIDSAATAFGRLSQLLKVPASEFENLGSSISRVGINSIATEQQIINISTQISSIASSANLTAAEIFGLSAALASVGTAPEASRGTITRFFTRINVAVARSGDLLNDFAKLAGMSAQEFTNAWGKDSRLVIEQLLQGLGGIDQAGGDAAAAIRALGITSVRDVPTLLKLAQNTDLVARAFNEAVQGYEEGTELQRQYAIVAETVAEKLTLLGNNFQSLIATIGKSAGSIAGVIDILIDLTQWLTRVADTPFAQWLAVAGAIAFTLIGTVALLGSAVTRAIASFAAWRTSIIETQFAMNGLNGTTKATAATLWSAVTATNAFKTALRGLAAASVIGIGFVALGAAIEQVMKLTESAEDRLESYFGAAASLSFSEALKADTATFKETGEAIDTFEASAKKVAPAAEDAESSIRIWLGAQREVPGASDEATDAVQRQTLALGENAEAWIRDALARDESIRQLAQDETLRGAFEALGGNMSDFIQAGLQGKAGQYLDGLLAPTQERMNELRILVDEALRSGEGFESEAIQSAIQEIEYLKEVNQGLTAALSEGAGMVDQFIAAQKENADVNAFLGGVLEDSTTSAEDFGNALTDVVDEIFAGVNEAAALADAMEDLGAVIFNSGSDAAFVSSEFQNLISTMIEQAGSAGAAVGPLEGLFQALIDGGYATADQLLYLVEVIELLKAEAGLAQQAISPMAKIDLTPLQRGFQGTERAARRTGGAAREAAQEVRTLVDYAKDLAGVFSRSFDIRFGVQSAEDSTRSIWLDIQDGAEQSAQKITDFRQKMRDLRADLQGLRADRAVQEYFLSVAEAYGDTLRAGQIRADIAKIDAEIEGKKSDLTKTEKDLRKEQEAASKTLNGNSRAAIENRRTIEQLLSSYRDQITTAAANGASQAELERLSRRLRDEFVRQARQAGFSTTEINKYAKSFDDFRTIIQQVPRNVTVSANANPAIQAMNEYRAAADRARNAVNNLGSAAGRSLPLINTAAARQAALQERVLTLTAFIANQRRSGNISGAIKNTDNLTRLQNDLRIGNFASGGFISGPGGPRDDRIPAMLSDGEYVIQAAAVSKYGVDYFDQLNQMKAPQYVSSGMQAQAAAAPTVGIMELGPKSLAAVRAIANQEVVAVLAASDAQLAQRVENGQRQRSASGAL